MHAARRFAHQARMSEFIACRLCPPSLHVCIQSPPNSPAKQACQHLMHKALNLRPLNQKPHAPYPIPLICIQPKREDDARGQGLGVAEPDGVYGLALMF